MTKNINAAIIIIGDEILSGRTKDTNGNTIAQFCQPFGIIINEIRVIGDDEDKIIKSINELRKCHNYIFTTGGIGPTHDDITAEAVAKAFGVNISIRDDAIAMMLNRYKKEDLTTARLRMARIPDGAILIKNPISFAPGFQIENVFVMAGVPNIMAAMLQDIAPRLETGSITLSKTISAIGIKEGEIAEPFGLIAKQYDNVSLGSYPWYDGISFGTKLVLRSQDENSLNSAGNEVLQMLIKMGLAPEIE